LKILAAVRRRIVSPLHWLAWDHNLKKLGYGRKVWLQRRDCKVRAQTRRKRSNAHQRIRGARDTLLAPSYFTIAAALNERSEAARHFLAFLRRVRTFRGKHLCIDMSRVGRLIVNAALLFKAELCYLSARGVKLSGKPATKARSQQVLTQTGIAELLSIPLAKAVDREDTLHWRHASGVWTRAQPSRLAALLDPELDPTKSSLYTGMIESVSNAIEHAYAEHPSRRHLLPEQDGWWGFQQLRDGVLSTCICDLGIGFTNALPVRLWSEPDLLHKLMALWTHVKGADVQSILAAIEYGRSSTNAPQRGKGLRDAHRVVDDAGEGHFQIASNGGFYFYKREPGKKDATMGTRRLQGSIAGTIYFWSFPLKSQILPAEPRVQGAIP